MNKRSLIILFSISFSISFIISNAQKSPKLYKWFYKDNGFYSIEHLVLSTDSIFFYAMSSETGQVFVSKGTWSIKNNNLYLKSWDSLKAYPKPTITFVKGERNRDIIISCLDYFQNPFDDLALQLISKGSMTNANAVTVFADSLGQFKVSKEEYAAFYFLYQFHNSDASLVDSIQVYNLDNDTKEINVSINFAAAAGLDRGVALINFGNHIYKMKDESLYYKDKLQFKSWKGKRF